MFIYIGVGLSALLVSTFRAMREPTQSGTSNKELTPRFFCKCPNQYQLAILESFGATYTPIQAQITGN